MTTTATTNSSCTRRCNAPQKLREVIAPTTAADVADFLPLKKKKRRTLYVRTVFYPTRREATIIIMTFFSPSTLCIKFGVSPCFGVRAPGPPNVPIYRASLTIYALRYSNTRYTVYNTKSDRKGLYYIIKCLNNEAIGLHDFMRLMNVVYAG